MQVLGRRRRPRSRERDAVVSLTLSVSAHFLLLQVVESAGKAISHLGRHERGKTHVITSALCRITTPACVNMNMVCFPLLFPPPPCFLAGESFFPLFFSFSANLLALLLYVWQLPFPCVVLLWHECSRQLYRTYDPKDRRRRRR